MKYNLFAEMTGLIASEFDFLAKAVSTNDTHFFMNFILVEQVDAEHPEKGLRAVATDGRRLHIVEPVNEAFEFYGITAGHYKVIKSTTKITQIVRVSDESAKECGQFPSWVRVMPTGDPVKVIDYNGFQLSDRHHNSQGLVKFFREFPEATVLKLNYLSDLGVDLPWKAEYREPLKAVRFTSNNLQAVIMPMQAD